MTTRSKNLPPEWAILKRGQRSSTMLQLAIIAGQCSVNILKFFPQKPLPKLKPSSINCQAPIQDGKEERRKRLCGKCLPEQRPHAGGGLHCSPAFGWE